MAQQTQTLPQPAFLPMTRREMNALGWRELDILLVSGDAYVDHPSFGVPLLGRWLIHHGYRVGIVAQPRWTTPADLLAMGRPRLFAGVSAGALDSMVAHYTAFRKKRSDDAYTPGGKAGARPNRACIVYAGLLKQAFPKLPIVLGGIEASLRRLTHYDFWTDKLRRSILVDAKADLLLYGMAERGILEAARQFDLETPDFQQISGAAFLWREAQADALLFPSHEKITANPDLLMSATLLMEQQVHHANQVAVQGIEGKFMLLTPPRPLLGDELDTLYSLPFAREPHPSYKAVVPAADMIRFSINSHRGCAGGCSFCTLAAHQGRTIRSRSADSIRAEVATLSSHRKWSGTITDVGGPSANMWQARCADDPSHCRRSSCLSPAVCPHFEVDQLAMLELLKEVKRMPKLKNVRIASGVRHDLALKDRAYIRELVHNFVGGQLKIAPEHFADNVLRLMRKPSHDSFTRFLDIFDQECREARKKQYVIPYLLTAFPGCTAEDTQQLAQWLRRQGWHPQQVQCFIPLPGTVAAAMYFTGKDPQGKAIYVARTDAERLRQHYAIAPSSQR